LPLGAASDGGYESRPAIRGSETALETPQPAHLEPFSGFLPEAVGRASNHWPGNSKFKSMLSGTSKL
jgi:hypothetical protein